MRRLFLLTAALILYGSLFPWAFHRPDPSFSLSARLDASWPNAMNRWLLKDALLNVLIYVPLGFIGALAFPRSRWKSWAVPILFGSALSAAVEFAQMFTYTRVTSAFDLLTNAAGAVIGAAAGHKVRFEWRTRLRIHSQPDELLILILFACWQLFPFFPVHGRGALFANLGQLFRFGWLTFLTAFVGWLCAGLAARGMLRGTRVYCLLLVIPVRPFILNQGVTSAEIAAAILALAAVSGGFPAPKLTGVLAVGMVFLRELMPLRFSGTPTAFNWIPFRASLSGPGWLLSSGILVEKLFFVAAAIWLLWRSGARLWPVTAAMALGLLAMELLQMYLPGRTPESTDAVLAIAAGILLDLVVRRRLKRARD